MFNMSRFKFIYFYVVIYYIKYYNMRISKFIFFYSDIYYFYNTHINENLNNIFDVEGIKIDDLIPKQGHTFGGGVSIKIELIINKIKENMNKHIIFSDASIFINKNKVDEIYDLFSNYLSYDMCFADNNINSEYNIGIILIYCCDKTLSFFETVLERLEKNKGWDQNVTNQLINSTDKKYLSITKFPINKIYCGRSLPNDIIDEFLIFKSFISHSSDANHNYNQRIQIFKNSGLISEDEYKSLLR